MSFLARVQRLADGAAPAAEPHTETAAAPTIELEPPVEPQHAPVAKFSREALTADQLLADLLARNPKPDWRAEHAAAVELVARACPTEREADLMRRRRSARSLVGFKLIADLDRHEFARNTLALLLAIPAVAAGGVVLWVEHADQAGLALEARTAEHERQAREAKASRRAA